jgi:ABC-type multidrug transport system fused ATPase/permease subunit
METDGYTVDQVLQVFFSIMLTGMGIGVVWAMTPDATRGRIAAARAFAVIDRASAIDPSSDRGRRGADASGCVAFRGVRFHYPSRPDVQVLRGLDLVVEAGTTVALVGGSGCGKSTTMQLLERFYDPQGGSVALGGVDVRELSVPWLRSQIGLVGQEPVLFNMSIADNIAYGKFGDVTREEVVEAAKMANAHGFIAAFPDGYDTSVGEGGGSLSGGQKQRIAIARAIIKDPAVLLLDEATSALDTESERVVQAALDRLLRLKRRTTIVIAHRLSTVRNADAICVLDRGRVVERGTHAELVALGGQYHYLSTCQDVA